jgi:hypothetical protein
MGEIVLERGEQPNIMKLDADEEAFMNEIEIRDDPAPPRRATAPRRRTKPAAYRAQQSSVGMPEIDAFTNPSKVQAPRKIPAEPVDYGEDEEEGGYEYEEEAQEMGEVPSDGFASIDDEKADLLNKLARLEKKGHRSSKKFTAYSSIDELRAEVNRIVYGIEIDQSVRFSRRMLIACVTGVEFLNKRYNPFDLALEGWSESVMENVDDYDGVFEELYIKYKTKMNVAPEVKLIMMLGGAAMMFHLTNSMFKAAIPNMGDVMKSNPDLMKNMMEAVANTRPKESSEDPTMRPTQSETFDGSGRREMQGPGMDISSLMGGIMMPPQAVSTASLRPPPRVIEDDNESLSDIVSISGESTGGEVKNVNISKSTGGRSRKGKKTEINL